MNKKINFLLSLILCFSFLTNNIQPISANDQANINVSEQNTIVSNELEAIEKENLRVIVELNAPSILDTTLGEGKNAKDLKNDSALDKQSKQIKATQLAKIKKWKSENLKIDTQKITHYDTSFNGVAFNISSDDLNKLKNDKDVKKVYLSQEFERPLLASSNELIGTTYAWDTLNYKGEGTVVAVIDSGIDASHLAMRLDDPSLAKLSEEKVEQLIENHKLKGKFISSKIPYAYNYYDEQHNLLNSYDVMHGMHVAGIVGANPPTGENETTSQVQNRGVAPNSQILALKVFSDDRIYPTTFTDIWLKAVDDAIKLGADVINLSLGASSGFSHEDDPTHPEIELLNKVREAGIVISVAGGNDRNSIKGNTYKTLALKDNYDTGVLANPAVNETTIAVASSENSSKMAYTLDFHIRKRGGIRAYHQKKLNLNVPANTPATINALPGFFVDLGTFDETQDENLHNYLNPQTEDQRMEASRLFNTKIVLIKMPKEQAKIQKMWDNLPKLFAYLPTTVLLYKELENENAKDDLLPHFFLRDELKNYLIGYIQNSTYELIKENFLTSVPSRSRLVLNTELKATASDEANTLSEFSSWGPTPDLRIKPEITAPGSFIYSTAENNSYQNMRGTSMSAPHVAGAAAILKQYLTTSNLLNLTEQKASKTSDFIKLLLLNTAKPLFLPETDIPYFVRQQGAGLMQLDKALSTPLTVLATGTNDEVEDGKLELKILSDKHFLVKLKITNHSNEDLRYKFSYLGITEEITEDNKRSERPRLLEKNTLNNIQNEEEDIIEIPQNSSISIERELSFNDEHNHLNNNYLEGFIQLKDVADEKPTISIPFLGFYGNFLKQKALDAFLEQAKNERAKREIQFYVNKNPKVASSMFITGQRIPIPSNQDTFFFSPKSIYHNQMYARLAPLRNIERLTYSIVDPSTSEEVRVLGYNQEVRKLSRLDRENSFKIMPNSGWDGKVNGQEVEEGKEYIYRLTAKLNLPALTLSDSANNLTGEQIFDYSVKLDNTPPLLSNLAISDLPNNFKEVSFVVNDSGVGLKDIYLQSVRYAKINEGFDPSLLPPPGRGDKIENDPLIPPPIIIPNAISDKVSKSLVNENTSSSLHQLSPTNQSTPTATTPLTRELQKPQYGKSIHLTLVDEEFMDGVRLPRIENNQLQFSLAEMSTTFLNKQDIYVYRNDYRNGNLTVSIPYQADRTHLLVSAKDALSHKSSEEIATGLTHNYLDVLFLNMKTQILDRGGNIKVNDNLQTEPIYRQLETSDEIPLSISFPEKNHYLYTLQIKNGRNIDILIDKGNFINTNIKKYKLKYIEDENSWTFSLPNLLKNTEIILGSKEGRFDASSVTTTYDVNLSNLQLDKFKSLNVDNERQNISEHLTLTSGSHWFELVFKSELDAEAKKIKNIVLFEENSTPILLKKRPQFDLETQEGFSASPYSLKIHFKLKNNTRIKAIYEDEDDEISEITTQANNSNPQNHNESTILLKDIILEDTYLIKENNQIRSITKNNSHDEDRDNKENETEITEENETNLVESKTYPYPSIYLLSPTLLKIVTSKDISEEVEEQTDENSTLEANENTTSTSSDANEKITSKIRVRGFVANIDRDDVIEDVKIYLVDEAGDKLDNYPILKLKANDLTKKLTSHGQNSLSSYRGIAYHFDVNLPIKNFNVNLKIETTTKNQKYGGMIRRFFYDQEYPLISSKILERNLNSESAKIEITVNDDSLKLDLFQNDSLILFEDKTHRSLKKAGVTLNDTLVVNLKKGQNNFFFRAVDLAGQNSIHNIYIYRTYK